MELPAQTLVGAFEQCTAIPSKSVAFWAEVSWVSGEPAP